MLKVGCIEKDLARRVEQHIGLAKSDMRNNKLISPTIMKKAGCAGKGYMAKISVRFFGDSEVRAVWDEEKSKWWFSVLDITGVLREEADYQKNRNYWKYLKAKLKKENPQLVSAANQLKITAADGKKYLTDTFDLRE